jgi:AraC-like DNA-binding protein
MPYMSPLHKRPDSTQADVGLFCRVVVFRNVLIVESVAAQILGLLLVAVLLSTRPRTTPNRLLSIALFGIVFRQFLLILEISGSIWAFPYLFRLSFPIQLMAIPAYYLYVVALTTTDFKLERKHALHLIPFAIGVAWYVATLIWGSPWLFQPGRSLDLELYARAIAKIAVMIPYFLAGRRAVLVFAREAKNHVSDISHLRLMWLRTLLAVAYASVLVNFVDVVAGPSSSIWLLIPGVWLMSLLALAYVSMRVSRMFAWEAECNKAERLPDFPEQIGDPKRRLSGLELQRLKARLLQVVENQALYLNPELRLSDLGEALGIRPYRVSEILNRGLQTSFYDLINTYRVIKARELLVSPDSAHLNLLGIAMESGFRSKSVFNEVFKKMTGKTPSEYRAHEVTESSDPDGRIARLGR